MGSAYHEAFVTNTTKKRGGKGVLRHLMSGEKQAPDKKGGWGKNMGGGDRKYNCVGDL